MCCQAHWYIFSLLIIIASWDDVKSNRESTVQHTHDSCQKLEPGSVLLRTTRSETYANEKGSSTDTLTKDISGLLDHSNWYIILSLIILDLILDHSFLSFRHYFLHTNVCFNIIIIIIIITDQSRKLDRQNQSVPVRIKRNRAETLNHLNKSIIRSHHCRDDE